MPIANADASFRIAWMGPVTVPAPSAIRDAGSTFEASGSPSTATNAALSAQTTSVPTCWYSGSGTEPASGSSLRSSARWTERRYLKWTQD